MFDRRLVVAVYSGFGAVGAGATIALGRDPLHAAAPLWNLSEGMREITSVALGVTLATATIAASRWLVARFAWAQDLQRELEPSVRGSSNFDLVTIAVASGIAEELLFRGLLAQVLGVALSSVIFGVVHRARGRARIAWMIWAGVMGAALGGIFVGTGSLLGPMVAHVFINAVNLRFVRDMRLPQLGTT